MRRGAAWGIWLCCMNQVFVKDSVGEVFVVQLQSQHIVVSS